MTPMLHGRCAFSSLVFTITLIGGASIARADPIPVRVTAGSIEFQAAFLGPEDTGDFMVSGTDRFSMEAGGSARGPSCTQCQPGEAVNLDVMVNANFGSITYQGETREFDFRFGPGGGELQAVGRTVVLPPMGAADVVTIETTFSLDPLNSIVGVPVEPDPEVPTASNQFFQLTGGGRGIATFRQDRDTAGFWIVDTIRFDFEDQAAIPEPSSVLLVGGVVTGTWLRRRLRGARP